LSKTRRHPANAGIQRATGFRLIVRIDRYLACDARTGGIKGGALARAPAGCADQRLHHGGRHLLAVRSAGSAQGLLEALKEGAPDLLLLDVMLPDGDGFDILGNGNFLKKDKAGDSGDNRNGGDGFHLVGNDNSFEECKANVNRGDGYDFAGTGNKLKKSTSNDSGQGGSKENAGFEYTFANPVLDLTGNKKDNANFVGAGVPKTYAAGNYE